MFCKFSSACTNFSYSSYRVAYGSHGWWRRDKKFTCSQKVLPYEVRSKAETSSWNFRWNIQLELFASRKVSNSNAYHGLQHNSRVLRGYSHDCTEAEQGPCSLNDAWTVEGHETENWYDHSRNYHVKAGWEQSNRAECFGKIFILNVLLRINFHMVVLRTIIYIIWKKSVQKNLIGCSVWITVDINVPSLPYTVLHMCCHFFIGSTASRVW